MTMMGRVSILTAALVLLLFLELPAHSQLPSPNLSGTLFIYVPGSSKPVPASGYKVFLYKANMGWSKPSFTDSYGRYALYGVPPGRYLMRVMNYSNAIVWQQEVAVPSQIQPIVLSRP